MIDYENNPNYLNSFINYSINIQNKSLNSVSEYYYDICNMLKYMKIHYKIVSEKDFNKITIKDVSIRLLRKIQLNDLYDYLTFLCDEKHLKPITRARKCSSVRIFFKYLYEILKVIKYNPANNLQKPKIEKREAVYLSFNECVSLIKTVKNCKNRNKKRNYAIIIIFLNCGIRLSELTKINISDIDFIDNKIRIIGKGNKERIIYLNNACINAINAYKEDRTEGALFLSERKNRISRREVQYIIKNEFRNAGLSEKYTVHKLRHTCATIMYQYGHVDIRLLQKILGHENITTTEIYTHVTDFQMQQAMNNNPLARIR